MKDDATKPRAVYSMVALGALLPLAGCRQVEEAPEQASVFSCDQAAVAGATPWPSENFRNDPDSFLFAVIGDRTGGGNKLGTFALAMDQLNLMKYGA